MGGREGGRVSVVSKNHNPPSLPPSLPTLRNAGSLPSGSLLLHLLQGASHFVVGYESGRGMSTPSFPPSLPPSLPASSSWPSSSFSEEEEDGEDSQMSSKPRCRVVGASLCGMQERHGREMAKDECELDRISLPSFPPSLPPFLLTWVEAAVA